MFFPVWTRKSLKGGNNHMFKDVLKEIFWSVTWKWEEWFSSFSSVSWKSKLLSFELCKKYLRGIIWFFSSQCATPDEVTPKVVLICLSKLSSYLNNQSQVLNILDRPLLYFQVQNFVKDFIHINHGVFKYYISILFEILCLLINFAPNPNTRL